MKIGIMGGTFNPIHNGHLMLGEYSYRSFGLDQVWFMPNGNPPHKAGISASYSADIRARMTELAIQDVPYFRLEDYEVRRQELSYSYQTLEHFKEIYPEDSFYFIIGADSLFDINKWMKPERILKICTILAAFRGDKNNSEIMNRQIELLKEKYGAETDIRLLSSPLMDVSSHELREMISEGKSISGLVPETVEQYIKEHGLYR
ncbi:nicotinate-nucleotide adenylyltransferase [Sporofaciens sp. SGI.106]|uniref:nicotinate-nucleotide adenylyltransferase n=1 Tax=Sporofaciens sp. SGI.106 TaxID=3420568 RepID=UPI002A983A5E|nr:nicotinate-nucleotide adenylyltransferase [Lachnoclostridium sp.]